MTERAGLASLAGALAEEFARHMRRVCRRETALVDGDGEGAARDREAG